MINCELIVANTKAQLYSFEYFEDFDLLEFSDLEPGEYGITISNPNNIDEKQIVISTFAVTE